MEAAGIEDNERLILIGANQDKPPARFKLCGKKYHLTYKGHLPLETLLTFLKAEVGELLWYSLVHENGSSAPPLDYHHTHVAFEAAAKINRNSARCLDFVLPGQPPVHPNIKPIQTQDHAKKIWNYHLKDPVSTLRSESGPAVSCPSLDSWKQAQAANSLREACLLLGVEPKTVSDVRALRSDKSVDLTIPPIVGECCWTLEAPERFRSLFVWGPTRTGKTRWAIAQFKSPLLVSLMEDLKKFSPDQHDGIVFDDMSLATLEPQVAIHLTDWEVPRSVNVKYGSATLPAGTRKIFTFNEPFGSCFPAALTERQREAVMGRMKVIHVLGPTFGTTRRADMEMLQSTEPIPTSAEEPTELLSQRSEDRMSFLDGFENW